jgi:hypothetical protein
MGYGDRAQGQGACRDAARRDQGGALNYSTIWRTGSTIDRDQETPAKWAFPTRVGKTGTKRAFGMWEIIDNKQKSRFGNIVV